MPAKLKDKTKAKKPQSVSPEAWIWELFAADAETLGMSRGEFFGRIYLAWRAGNTILAQEHQFQNMGETK
jgi:hypothetical protein